MPSSVPKGPKCAAPLPRYLIFLLYCCKACSGAALSQRIVFERGCHCRMAASRPSVLRRHWSVALWSRVRIAS
eukprot:scaffold62_cov256-Pinguiococcus_pyrenoidosus.AAC.9